MKPRRPARLEVLCVGTELLTGKVNTHMAFFAPALRGVGLPIGRETTVGDSVGEIRDAAAAALSRADVLLVSGGLGPTFDDLTREGVAEALGVRMSYRPAIFAEIAKRFRRYGYKAPEENKRQAFVLDGADVLPNPHGSAPGQRIASNGKTIFLVPGPTSEMRPMVEDFVLPYLRRRYGGGRAVRYDVLHMAEIPESAADERLDPLYKSAQKRGVEFTILSQPGLVDLHITAAGRSAAQARRRFDSARAAALRLVGKWVFGEGPDSLESVVGETLKRRGWTLAAAESCTGGLLSKRVTDVPGSSAFFLGGAVCYANAAKERELGVPRELLARSGAVSEPAAAAMADGARARWSADVAVSITGIAGPGGATKAKPVGLTYIGLAMKGRPTEVKRFRFFGARDAVRNRAAIAALTLLWRALS